MLGKTEGQEEKGVAEVGTVGWSHRLSGYEAEQTLGRQQRTGKRGMLQFMGSQTDMT